MASVVAEGFNGREATACLPHELETAGTATRGQSEGSKSRLAHRTSWPAASSGGASSDRRAPQPCRPQPDQFRRAAQRQAREMQSGPHRGAPLLPRRTPEAKRVAAIRIRNVHYNYHRAHTAADDRPRPHASQQARPRDGPEHLAVRWRGVAPAPARPVRWASRAQRPRLAL